MEQELFILSILSGLMNVNRVERQELPKVSYNLS